MIILGIDPGTAKTGWGLIEVRGNTYSLIAYGVITPKAKILSQKYEEIYDGITEVIKKFHPHALSVETQFVGKNPQSAIKIGMARGMALLAGVKGKLSIFEYTPLKAKQAVTGSGRAKKEDIQKMLSLLLNISKSLPHDAADALALALCHAHQANSPLTTPI